MITLRPERERGRAEHGWLSARHTFSFADYYDPRQMGFRALRVLNEDRVQPGHGFPAHGHRDMEILTWVLEGELRHGDSLGGEGGVIRPGDVQLISAGTGVVHSEANPSATQPVHLLQIWIEPAGRGGKPAYAQRHLPEPERRGRLRVVAAPEARAAAEEALGLRQDAWVLTTLLEAGAAVRHELRPGRHAWVQVARGAVLLNGHALSAGAGAAASAETHLDLVAREAAELLVFDLA